MSWFDELLFEFENVSPRWGDSALRGALAPPLGELAKISDFRLRGDSKYQRHPLSHGVRRDSSPKGGAKGGAPRSGFK